MEYRITALNSLRRYKEEQWAEAVQQFREAHGAAVAPPSAGQGAIKELVDNALEVMKKKPKDGRTFYWLLHFAYLSDVKLTVANILKELEKKEIILCRTAYFKLRQQALEALGGILEGCRIAI